MYKKAFLAIILSLMLFSFGCSKHKTVQNQERLKEMSQLCYPELTQEEKDNLYALYRHLLCKEDFAFVAFGHKPLALGGFWELPADLREQDIPLPIIFFLLYPDNVLCQKGWQAWEKVRHRFGNSNLQIVQIPDPYGDYYKLIVLINKTRFLQTVTQHLPLFQSVLGNTATPEMVLDRFISGHVKYTQLLNGNHELMGLLLGYGETNSKLFQRQYDLSAADVNEFRLKPEWLRDGENTNRELAEIVSRTCCFSINTKKNTSLNFIGLFFPRFVVDSSTQETKNINQTLLEDYAYILKQSKDRDLVDWFFSVL